MLYQKLCQKCGGDLRKVDDTHYACECCNTTYSTEKIDSYAKKIDDTKRELISNARKNLYNALTVANISAKEVHECCVEIKKYIPDDFQANFYDAFLNSPPREIAKLIRKVDVKENFEHLDIMLTFIIKSLEKEFVLDTQSLIERAYKGEQPNNLAKYREYTTMVANEAEKLDACVYLTSYPRDVFVAYSSKDTKKVLELVDELEEQGLSCFISIRNLRHGAGSRENYDIALKEAMDACTSFVFVSSTNSREPSCDALSVEIPYIKSKDIKNAKGYAQTSYINIPSKFKKPRVEYVIEESKRTLAADRVVKEFFAGYERVYAPIDVAQRILEQSENITTEPPVKNKEIVKKVKYCISCFTECKNDAKHCSACGETSFANTKKEAELTNELNKIKVQRKKAKELKRNQEKEKRKQKKEWRKKEKEQLKQEKILDDNHKNKALKRKNRITIISVLTCVAIIVAFFIIKNNILENNPQDKMVIENGVLISYKGNWSVVTIPEEVVEIGDKAFSYSGPKNHLTKIILPEKLTSIGNKAFKKCYKLETVIIPHNVKHVGESAFEGCSSLTNLTFENGVCEISKNMFKNCTKLTQVEIPGSIKIISDHAFENCKNLLEISFGEGIIEIGEGAFEKCPNIRSICLPKSLEIIWDDAFKSNGRLSKIYIRSNVKKIGSNVLKHTSNVSIYYEGTYTEWGKINKGFSLFTWSGGSSGSALFYGAKLEDVFPDKIKETEKNTENTEPAMYCILPKKSKEVMPIA